MYVTDEILAQIQIVVFLIQDNRIIESLTLGNIRYSDTVSVLPRVTY